MYVKVLVQININDDKLFTYAVPSILNDKINIGSRVRVPFANRIIEGFIMNISDKLDSNIDTKDIIDVLDEEPLLNEEMLHLGKYISQTYMCSLITAYKAMIPSALRFKSKDMIKKEKYIRLLKDAFAQTKAENNIINRLKEGNTKKSEIKNKEALKKLIESKIVEEYDEEIYRINNDCNTENGKILTENQEKAFNEINNTNESIYLLRGITGSGKTEIYMKLIEEAIKNKKQSIVLVPEISITTQLINRFKCRFGNKIAIFHSALNDGERYDEWRKIKRGEVDIVVGARSAIFSPFSNLGLIILDEEHENTYKQENTPRYDTVDIAIERTKYNNSKLLFGSATPSLESYARAKVGKYKLVELLERVNKLPLPKVTIVDMKKEIKNGKFLLSKIAIEKINEKIDKNEQIMILLNRRGYSNYLICDECGTVLQCPNCDISLTYHKSENIMRCHYCGYAENKPNTCKKCSSKHVHLMGSGTEKIEEELQKLFKKAKVVRMDADTTSKKGMHERIINDFNSGKYNILLGTQMIAKGLDFDNVTLMVILSGDYSLNIPDYRSSERTFQLLTQASGRAGRKNKEGEIIIQTFNPDHYAIVLSQNHDYTTFFNREMIIRKKLNYPPFCFIVSIRIISTDFDLGNKEILKIHSYLVNNLDNKYTVLGPSSSLRINNEYRFQCIVKYKDREYLYEVLNYIKKHYSNSKTKLEIDFNPIRL